MKYKDPFDGEFCRDDRCERTGAHPPHVITEKKRGRPPKKDHTQVVVSPPSPPKAKVRGWHKCHTCAGRGTCFGHRCALCEGKGSVFVGSKKPTGKSVRGKQLVLNGKSKTVPEWSEELGIPKITIYKRLRIGMPIEKVLAKGRLK